MCLASFSTSRRVVLISTKQIANHWIGKVIEQTLADDAERRELQLFLVAFGRQQLAKNRQQDFKLRPDRRLHQLRAGGAWDCAISRMIEPRVPRVVRTGANAANERGDEVGQLLFGRRVR